MQGVTLPPPVHLSSHRAPFQTLLVALATFGGLPSAQLLLIKEHIIRSGRMELLSLLYRHYRTLQDYRHAVAQWLRHYATSWKVVGSRRNNVNEFFQFT
jgi:hypothetical protein